MKNINESELKKYILKRLQESYFDELEFDDEAMRAAMADIEADPTAGEFEELGSSKFEKGSDFGKKLKSSLKQANLELPSDEAEVKYYAQLLKKRKAQEDRFGKGSLNEIKMEYIEDSKGNPIKLKSQVKDIETGVIGYVDRFMQDHDTLDMLVSVNWINRDELNVDNPIDPKKLIVKENTMMNEEAYEASRYMFFSNLQQIRRQAGLLLDMDEDQLNSILENGHDWAQDHIATAKESIDQVFDFLMNETKSDDIWKSNDVEDMKDEEIEADEEIEEGMGRSYTVGMNKNEKPVDYPEDLMREAVKDALQEVFGQFKSTSSSSSPSFKMGSTSKPEGDFEKNLGSGVKLQDVVSAVKNVLKRKGNVKGELEKLRMKSWKGTPEGWHEFISNKKYFAGTNESIEEGLGKYYITDSDFNNANYPDLVGKFFEDKPDEGVEFELIRDEKEIEESSSDSLMNKHGKNAKPNVSYLKKEGYENIIELQDNQANHIFTLLKQDGPEEAIEYLKEFHKPGTHNILSEIKKSALDKSYEKNGYTLTWNPSVGFVKLSYKSN